MQKLTVTFRKGEGARFLSHLDLTATLEYAVRRARLPVSLSEGFNPRPRLSVAASLEMGYVGEAEILEITLRESVDLAAAGERLGAALPAGIEIIAVEQAELGAKTAASRL
jgi:radical SAM-linked protein